MISYVFVDLVRKGTARTNQFAINAIWFLKYQGFIC